MRGCERREKIGGRKVIESHYYWCGIPCDYDHFGLRCYQTPDFPQVNISDEPCDQIVPLSAKEVVAGGLSLLPNPAHSSIQIALPENGIAAVSLRVLDLAGHTMLMQPWPPGAAETGVDVTALPAGVYMIVVQGIEAVFREKFIKS